MRSELAQPVLPAPRISKGEDIVRVSRLTGDSTASFTLNVCSHMLPRERDASGDRLAFLVFGNKVETVANLPAQLERLSVENLEQIGVVKVVARGGTSVAS